MDKYEIISRIGEGAHGMVLKARSLERNELVALKRIRLKSSDANSGNVRTMIYREIRVLQELTHKNIIAWYDAFLSPDATTIIAVFEYLPSDLSEVMRCHRYQLPIGLVRSLTKQLFTGLAYMHNCGIMHRDLKPSNLLISDKNELKIGDFGQACLLIAADATRTYDHQVATRRYRAIELLLGSQTYGFGVDLWAAGCILAEMIYGHPIFPGESDIEQIFCIIHVLGTPTADELIQLQSLPDYGKLSITFQAGIEWHQLLSEADESAISLISSLLKYGEKERIPALDVLIHPFVNESSSYSHPASFGTRSDNTVSTAVDSCSIDFNAADSVNKFYPSAEHIIANNFTSHGV